MPHRMPTCVLWKHAAAGHPTGCVAARASTWASILGVHSQSQCRGNEPQITSLMLHWMPACVLWTLRWYPDRSVKLDYDGKSDAAKADWQHGSLYNLVLLPLIPYLLWAVAYYVKVLISVFFDQMRKDCTAASTTCCCCSYPTSCGLSPTTTGGFLPAREKSRLLAKLNGCCRSYLSWAFAFVKACYVPGRCKKPLWRRNAQSAVSCHPFVVKRPERAPEGELSGADLRGQLGEDSDAGLRDAVRVCDRQRAQPLRARRAARADAPAGQQSLCAHAACA